MNKRIVRIVAWLMLIFTVGGLLLGVGISAAYARQVVTDPQTLKSRQAIELAIQKGKEWIGNGEYVLGGGHGHSSDQPDWEGPNVEVDATGFIGGVYAKGAGVFLGNFTNSTLQQDNYSEFIKEFNGWDKVRRGDLVVTNSDTEDSHVSIFLGIGNDGYVYLMDSIASRGPGIRKLWDTEEEDISFIVDMTWLIEKGQGHVYIQEEVIVSDGRGDQYLEMASTSDVANFNINVKESDGITPQKMAEFLKSSAPESRLIGHEDYFFKMADKYGINAAYALAQMNSETSMGQAYCFGVTEGNTNHYNFGCIKSSESDGFPSSPGGMAMPPTAEEGIEHYFSLLRYYVDERQLTRVADVINIYAPSNDGNNHEVIFSGMLWVLEALGQDLTVTETKKPGDLTSRPGDDGGNNGNEGATGEFKDPFIWQEEVIVEYDEHRDRGEESKGIDKEDGVINWLNR